MPLSIQKLVFLGAGNMAEAIVKGLLTRRVLEAARIAATDVSAERLTLFRNEYGVTTHTDNAEAVRGADVVVLAVKPAHIGELLAQIRADLPAGALIVSIAAGVTCARIEQSFDGPRRVVRVMPNTPALVLRGAAGISRGAHATARDMETAVALFHAVGLAEEVPEAQLDAVTALSGSGPAYVFYLAEAMLQAAHDMGLDDKTARALAVQTLEGSAVLLRDTGLPPEELRRRVTSKGGTTAAAVAVFDGANMQATIRAGLLAACARSRELSGA
jgi:pyrroline-5-carboxylate reductase